MTHDFYIALRTAMGVTRQAAYHWRQHSLSKWAKHWLTDNAVLRQHEGQHFVCFAGQSFVADTGLWGELKGRQELKESLKTKLI